MAEIYEIKRPEWRNPLQGLQNALDGWKSGEEPAPIGAAMVTIGEDGKVEIYSYGVIGSNLEVIGAFALAQAKMTTAGGSDG